MVIAGGAGTTEGAEGRRCARPRVCGESSPTSARAMPTGSAVSIRVRVRVGVRRSGTSGKVGIGGTTGAGADEPGVEQSKTGAMRLEAVDGTLDHGEQLRLDGGTQVARCISYIMDLVRGYRAADERFDLRKSVLDGVVERAEDF